VLRVYRLLFMKAVVSPNTLTVFGLFFSILASVFTGVLEQLWVAGVCLVLAGFFDLMDGAVARNMNMETRFGGFFDSVLDRYSDLLVMMGIFVHFLRLNDAVFSALTFFAAIGVALIPYARARAEAASIACRNGLLERPERIALLIIALFFNVLQPVVVLFAVLTHVTVLQRIFLVRKSARD
jgi:phosphatidylglycerophosphate synthase